MTDSNPRVIVALDFADPADALALASRLDPSACALKVGKELFVAAGPEPVRAMIAKGFRVFLDLKFHDIPNTVGLACAAATRLGVWMLNVHAAGGAAMLAAARRSVDATAAALRSPPPLLIAVTVLTSLDDADLRATGVDGDTMHQALRLARLTAAAGLDGVVCSAREAPALRAAEGPSFQARHPGYPPGRQRGGRSIADHHARSRGRRRRRLSRHRASDHAGAAIPSPHSPPSTRRSARPNEDHDDRDGLRGARHRDLPGRSRQRRRVRRRRCAQDRDAGARRRADPRARSRADDPPQRRGGPPPLHDGSRMPRLRTARSSSSPWARRPTRTARPTCSTCSPRRATSAGG